MSLSLTYENPAFPADTEFSIQGVGVVKNGESVEVSEEQETSFISIHGKTLEEAVGQNEGLSLSGTGSVKLEDVMPAEISDTSSTDPTAMNLVDGEVFEFANLGGRISDPDVEPVVEEEAPVTPTTVPTSNETDTHTVGGDN